MEKVNLLRGKEVRFDVIKGINRREIAEDKNLAHDPNKLHYLAPVLKYIKFPKFIPVNKGFFSNNQLINFSFLCM